MKPIVFSIYEPPDVLQPKEVEKPRQKGNEIVIRVHATSLTILDTLVRIGRAVSLRDFTMPGSFWLINGMHFGLGKSKITILGAAFARETEAEGKVQNDSANIKTDFSEQFDLSDEKI